MDHEIKIVKRLWLVLVLLSASAWAESKAPVVDILQLIGQSMEQTEAILGAPSSCKETYQGTSCSYTLADTEVVFINGRADWITVSKLPGVTFGPKALTSVGLRPVQPLVANPFRMHWEMHHGLELISVFNGGAEVALIQIRAYTRD